MKSQELIEITEICTHHQIEHSFIYSLQETDLIEIVTIEKAYFINKQQLPQLERYIDFHYTLGINIEGIDTINHLLKRMENLQEEVKRLKNELLLHQYTP